MPKPFGYEKGFINQVNKLIEEDKNAKNKK